MKKNSKIYERTGSLLNEILEGVKSATSYLDYWNAYRRIKKLSFDDLEIPESRKVKVGILSSFTVEPLVVYLDVKIRLAGLYPEIYVSPFNQYPQEILDKNSKLYAFNPDVIVIAIQAESLLSNEFLSNFIQVPEERKKEKKEEVVNHVKNLISVLTSRTNALVLMNNFIVPWFSPLGILDNKVEIGLKEFFQELDTSLAKVYGSSKQVYIVDLESLAGKYGKSGCINYEMYYRGAIALSELFLLVVADEYLSYIKALKNLMRKCIVLDLDNVLWGGTLGEDGFDGIKLGGSPEGEAYIDFQRLLLSLYNRGIILAVNSKNNYEDAIKVINEHPNMILREKHFAAAKINWKDKVENMVAIADELNTGLDSMVFIDDSPQEREWMKRSLPEIYVLDLPKSPFQYCESLKGINDFNTLILSEEDKRRGEMYYARRKRTELMRSTGSLEDFLRSLDIRVEIRYADGFSIPRVTSLINRTNQFNLTSRRYTQTEVEKMCSKPDEFSIYSMKVADKFGDEGIVGVAIVKKKTQEWIIDSFLLSCRVIGRKVETSLLAKILKDARKNGVFQLIGEYVPTRKNVPAVSFYSDHGFELLEKKENIVKWSLNLKKANIKAPEWMRVIYD
jgi:FkbH-like protein